MKREYHGFVNIFITFAFLDLFRNFFVFGKPYPKLMWIILSAAAAVIWFIIHLLKKNTTLFHVKGR
jgi:hypothetical protein